MVLVSQRIQYRPANPVPSVALNRDALGRIKFSDCIDQPYGTITHQIIQFDVRRKTSAKLQSYALDKRQQSHHQIIGGIRIM